MKQESSCSVRTTCPYCGVGCGVIAQATSGQAVAGDAQHPANHGRLCVKGASLHETLGSNGRLLSAKVRGRTTPLAEALDATAEAIRQSIETYGPGSVAFYLSGQLLTEDYYVANKLAKGFLKTPHVDTNSRLCMSSAVAAHKRAFGADVVPGCYEDLELAELLVLTGSNTAWNHPILYQRMKAAARRGRRVVVIDPRETATTELADLHLKLRPGTDTVLFNGLLVWLVDHNAIDWDFVDNHCQDLDVAVAAAREAAPDVAAVAALCDLAKSDVEAFFEWFAATPRTVTGFSQGSNQSVAGTDKGNAIINCHLATGRIGKPGASPFSITGQPNAMGGREVGGLANTLAAHMDYDSPGACDRVARFWQTDAVADGPGLKAVDLFDAVHRGDIKVLWVMATNPAVSLPDSTRVREAIKRCPTVIVSDCIARTDTTMLADILLPAAGWGEKNGTVTNSERRISRQRSFLPQVGDARPDWWLVSEVARRLGHAHGFGYDTAADIFREHAALSGFENDGARLFDISALATLSDAAYDTLEPVQWPVRATATNTSQRLFSDGRFCTPEGRGRLIPIRTVVPAAVPTTEAPMIVNTGRVRDQWHTMTRTARSPRLLQHRSEPFIEMHPDDRLACGIEQAGLATLEQGLNRFTGRVRETAAQRRGEVFIPIHWNQQYASAGLASQLIARVVDPISGQPESKHGVAALKPFEARWYARLLCPAEQPRSWLADYWSHAPLADCDSWWLAGQRSVDWSAEVGHWLGGAPQMVLSDPQEGRFRAARLKGGRVVAILLVDAISERLPPVDWLASCFALDKLTPEQCRNLLSGRDVAQEDIGTVVCSCFQVGERQIAKAIADGAQDVATLGAQLKCGTNCGSCLPELKALVSRLGLEPAEH
ncbi:nitrate reductase [Marinobacter caseinilyticus]|uniref:nitrate reductase n=1 Tax=Marinobacter caseinilyticus TaxID=2692195 RepID=UPI0014099D75|nr:nitrate reductase [Marinobacter caseinilyticus]